ncbi:MAG: class I SAM-dependent methyltransferase [Alphaproteobacteria bacterium]
MTAANLKLGEYTGLGESYSRFRPGYSESVLAALCGLLRRPVSGLDAVDVGAGTGIWSRMLAKTGFRSVTAVEPNDDMRSHGIRDSEGTGIVWRAGTGESTGLADNCCDLVSMASSFHWVDFEKGTAEFRRMLRPGGQFIALWNPRYIEANPILVEIEDKLNRMKPDMKRVSSGRSGRTENLTEMLQASPHFEDVVYIEGRHVSLLTVDQYIGAWQSVNDIQVQLGTAGFAAFLDFIRDRLKGMDTVEATYLTRAWVARAA